MDSDESMTVRSCISSMQKEEFDHEVDDMEGGDYHQPHNYFSRLSVCTTTPSTHDDHVNQPPSNSNYEDYDHNDMEIYHMMSGLSIESFDGDVEDEFSDDRLKRTGKGLDHQHNHMGIVITSNSDQESGGGCYSLLATPPRMRSGRNHRRRTCIEGDGKEYVSENKAAADHSRRTRWRRKRMIMKERLVRERDWKKLREEETMMMMEMENQTHEGRKVGVLGDDDNDNSNSKSSSTGGESQSESSSVPMVVITRPKREKRTLRMYLEEVKACRELGFDLEMPLPLPLPLPLRTNVTNLSTDTASTATTSGGNSPVHWRISSPGDDPQDVKARLKVWAQAVALASTSRQAS